MVWTGYSHCGLVDEVGDGQIDRVLVDNGRKLLGLMTTFYCRPNIIKISITVLRRNTSSSTSPWRAHMLCWLLPHFLLHTVKTELFVKTNLGKQTRCRYQRNLNCCLNTHITYSRFLVNILWHISHWPLLQHGRYLWFFRALYCTMHGYSFFTILLAKLHVLCRSISSHMSVSVVKKVDAGKYSVWEGNTIHEHRFEGWQMGQRYSYVVEFWKPISKQIWFLYIWRYVIWCSLEWMFRNRYLKVTEKKSITIK